MIISDLFDFIASGFLVEVFPRSLKDDANGNPVFKCFFFKIRKTQTFRTQTFYSFKSYDEALYKDMTLTDFYQKCKLFVHSKVTGDKSYECVTVSPDPLEASSSLQQALINHACHYYSVNPDIEPSFDILHIKINEAEQTLNDTKKVNKKILKITKKMS